MHLGVLHANNLLLNINNLPIRHLSTLLLVLLTIHRETQIDMLLKNSKSHLSPLSSFSLMVSLFNLLGKEVLIPYFNGCYSWSMGQIPPRSWHKINSINFWMTMMLYSSIKDQKTISTILIIGPSSRWVRQIQMPHLPSHIFSPLVNQEDCIIIQKKSQRKSNSIKHSQNKILKDFYYKINCLMYHN